MLLADAIDLQNPLFWAIIVGWILSVVLHEFAHGFVAYLGGDYTIRERGGLTLNPIKYIDPFMSLILPAVFLLLGGIPLPGGATYIRRDLLRSKEWQSLVSLAGPAMNLLLFVVCILPLHPKLGWADYSVPVTSWSNLQIFLGATAVLQLMAVILNLVPVPPLDGFGVLSPFMKEDLRRQVTTPPLSTILFITYFVILWMTNFPETATGQAFDFLTGWLRFDDESSSRILECFNIALFGHN
ncbi:MAG TPA: site-2 protease family protein [Tepidisphaeraceae bacterium]|jgi:Zn-dependent protease|nr:site-2 protease family protein [Tepidisphaeraceae bacterium]